MSDSDDKIQTEIAELEAAIATLDPRDMEQALERQQLEGRLRGLKGEADSDARKRS